MKPRNVLVLPGWENSGPRHWQSLWEQRHGYRRVEQHDWMKPLRGDWIARLEDMVLDCDEHGGNGTEEFAARLPNLYAVSIFGTRFGCRGGVRSWAYHVTHEQGYAEYRRALGQAAALVDEHRPHLLVYQAGADCHREDPTSQLKLTTDELFERDLTEGKRGSFHTAV